MRNGGIMDEMRLSCYVGIKHYPDGRMDLLVRGGGSPISFVPFQDYEYGPVTYSCSVLFDDFDSLEDAFDAFLRELMRGRHLECLNDDKACYEVLAIEAFVDFSGGRLFSAADAKELVADIISGEDYVLEAYPELIGMCLLDDSELQHVWKTVLLANGFSSYDVKNARCWRR